MERHPTVRTPAIRILIVGVGVLGPLLSIAPARARQTAAQAPPAGNCQPGQDLITVPEIKSENGRLRAEMVLTSGKRTLWGSTGDTRCAQQDLRYFKGRNLLPSGPEDPAFSTGEPIPGPTLRARVGDLIEVKFLNHIDTQAFANTLDQNSVDPANTTGCDEVRSNTGLIYPNLGAGGDVMPNCLHGSSTSNIHFHGTHTTPSTTGDNILLFVTPALRGGRDRKQIKPDDGFVDRQFAQIFSTCEAKDSPKEWRELPGAWRADQERLLKEYDRTAPFRGQAGKLPHHMQLWPSNQDQIAAGVWPQYQLGAYPYCFRLADYKQVDGKPSHVMGQAPGTHWYHAHKHGSTALNVANGMTGAFIIEGQYDDDLRRFYGSDFRDRVLVVQQLSTTPFPVLAPRPNFQGPGSIPKPQLSVNGRLNPIVRMRPGEVQRWRIVNGAFRNAVQFQSVAPQGGVAWRQIAQDGVQFAFASYTTAGAMNRMFNLAPANRADLLVRASTQPGTYALTVQPNEGLALDPTNTPQPEKAVILLTVRIEGTPVSPPKDFIQNETDFPAFPAFLKDLADSEIAQRRQVDFGAAHNLIDGKSFDPTRYSQVMELNDAEEWKITNQANDKAHPFHIHINPFQITEVFQPNLENTKNPTQPCYVDPLNPATWKPCTPLTGPFSWWDTFAIPASTAIAIPTTVCTVTARCPGPIQPYTACTTGANAQCTVTIPGYFKMRTRFVDYTGAYVIHCHILIHEDRGMMQLIEVVADKPPYVH